MFYITMEDGKPVFHKTEQPNSIPVDDEYENTFLYDYDQKRNKLTKKNNIEYTVFEENNEVIVEFKHNRPIHFKAVYTHNRVTVEEFGFTLLEGEVSTLRFNINLNGNIRIYAQMIEHIFLPIEIVSEDKCDDEVLPVLTCVNGVITLDKGLYYREIDALKEEIKKLKGE